MARKTFRESEGLVCSVLRSIPLSAADRATMHPQALLLLASRGRIEMTAEEIGELPDFGQQGIARLANMRSVQRRGRAHAPRC
jgi:hypothetical protein